VHLEDGTSVCVNRQVIKGSDLTQTVGDRTLSGTRSPWATVTNVGAALPGSDDDGGAGRALAHGSFLGVVLTSIGLGAVLALA
jgi:hypothetical protein